MIQSGYNPQGGNQTTTSTMGLPSLAGPMGLPFDPTAALRERLRMEQEQKAFENQLRERQMRLQEQSARAQEQAARDQQRQSREAALQAENARRTAPRPVDPLDQLKAADRYEMSLRNSALRPTGLGPNMIPGMGVDPNRLPSRLRPGSSSFQGGMEPSRAQLSPSAPPPPPTSNRGFDFADPYSQAQIQRSAFGGK
jgi:hypothetical protein